MGMMRSTLALSLMLLTGCSTSRSLLVEPRSDPQEETLGAGRQRITGYVVRGGQRLAFDGYVEARSDTLHFVRPRSESRGLEQSKPMIVRNIPRDSVVAVEGAFTSVPATVFLGIGIITVILLLLGLSYAASLAS